MQAKRAILSTVVFDTNTPHGIRHRLMPEVIALIGHLGDLIGPSVRLRSGRVYHRPSSPPVHAALVRDTSVSYAQISAIFTCFSTVPH